VLLQVWELVPAALQESLTELVGERAADSVAEAEVSGLMRLFVTDSIWGDGTCGISTLTGHTLWHGSIQNTCFHWRL
jgi:hypothetical protein